MGWKLSLVAVAIAAGVAVGRGPWGLAETERRAAVRDRMNANESEAKRVEMVRREAALRSPLGREALARERGYLKPGEMPAPPVLGARQ